MPAKSQQTTARCLGLVSTAFIAPDGGRPNIAAKTVATLWYLLVLPDAQSRLHRQLHHKRMPWYAPSRIVGAALAAANIVTMPLSWALLFAGKRNASRLAAVGVLLNPPSITLSILLISELSGALVRKTCRVVRGAGKLAVKPFQKKNEIEAAATASTTSTTATPAAPAASVAPAAPAASAAPATPAAPTIPATPTAPAAPNAPTAPAAPVAAAAPVAPAASAAPVTPSASKVPAAAAAPKAPAATDSSKAQVAQPKSA